MGQPAARLGDMTAHGTPLAPGPGSPNVLIGGRPAWRALVDVHVCPMVTPAGTPHGSGMVTVGSATVFIGGSPAARLGDIIVEPGGGPNSIVTGEFTVLIG
jgi:uncharacterized Zn-binding protein involved in type VI secretion